MDSKNSLSAGHYRKRAPHNAYKYAFPDGRRGTISISLRQLETERWNWYSGTDGVGMREPSGSGESKGFA